jgi:anti-repressor protein
MKALIEISNKTIGAQAVQSVLARDLYLGLGLAKANWSQWLKINIEQNEFFAENKDWVGFMSNMNGNETRDFAITIDFAKHIAMMAKTERAHLYRNYFLECEKQVRYGLVQMPDLSNPALLQTLLLDNVNKVLALQSEVKEKNTVIEQQATKVLAHDKLTLADGSLNITESAKALNVPPQKMFKALEMAKWIYRRVGGSNWLGYQDKIQRGYVTHKITTVKMNDGSEKISEQVRITPKGLTKLATMEFAA